MDAGSRPARREWTGRATASRHSSFTSAATTPIATTSIEQRRRVSWNSILCVIKARASRDAGSFYVDMCRPMAYMPSMEFEWDEAKSDACFVQRGFDFAYAVRAFLDPSRTVGRDRRWDYGEERYRLLGMIEERVFVVIFTVRNSVIRVISARKANKREVWEYEKDTSQD